MRAHFAGLDTLAQGPHALHNFLVRYPSFRPRERY